MRRFWKARVRVVALVTAVLVIASGWATIATDYIATVTGGIIPCSGLPVADGPHYSAGTVVVLRGHVAWKSTGQGNYVDIFPTTVVAQQSVATNQAFSFALDPGRYVLRARYEAPAGVLPFTEVTVRAGDNLAVDIPNECL